jgi:hypothetical protein
MKTLLILLTVLTAGTLAAQPPKNIDHSVNAAPSERESLIVVRPEAANSIAGRKVVYSGIAVQVSKAKQPLQLINPLAPAQYGSGHENLDRDLITGKVTGFKIISISF